MERQLFGLVVGTDLFKKKIREKLKVKVKS